MTIFDLGDLSNQSVSQSDFASSLSNDFIDIYKFNTTNTSEIEVLLNNTSLAILNLNIDLGLFFDSNSNGFLDAEDEEVAASRRLGNAGEFIAYTGEAGTYFARTEALEFYELGGGYTISVAVDTLTENTPPDTIFVPEVEPEVGPEAPTFEGDFLVGTLANDEIFAGDRNSIIIGDSEGDLEGDAGGNDALFGGAGDDIILSGVGDDVVFGGAGDDVIFGDRGNDLIFGGAGTNLLYGGTPDGEGAGSNIFAFELGDGIDIVLDFEIGVDAIGLTEGLSFGQLYIAQSGQDTIIGTAITGRARAVLVNVEASGLSEQAFVSIG